MINFGIVYGMTWMRLQRECKGIGIELTKDEAQAFIDNWFEVLPQVKLFFAHCRMKALVLGYSETILKRKRYYKFVNTAIYDDIFMNTSMIKRLDDWNWCADTYTQIENHNYLKFSADSKIMRECQNAPIQGSNADACRIAMNKVYSDLVLTNLADLLLLVHDEFVLECNQSNASLVSDELKYIMENAIPLQYPSKAEPIIVQSWGDAK